MTIDDFMSSQSGCDVTSYELSKFSLHLQHENLTRNLTPWEINRPSGSGVVHESPVHQT